MSRKESDEVRSELNYRYSSEISRGLEYITRLAFLFIKKPWRAPPAKKLLVIDESRKLKSRGMEMTRTMDK